MKSSIAFNRIMKGVFAIGIMMLFFGITGNTARAASTNEVEPNDTMATAQSISANNETAAGAINGSYSGQQVINGYTSNTDEDWFVVYLNSGVNYLTCNGNTFDYEVRNSSGDTVRIGTYTKIGFGPTAYSLNIPSDGYYYVKITGILSTSNSYLFLIGSPTYSVSSGVISCAEGTISMTSGGGSQTGHFYGNSVSFPEDAIVYSVQMNGVRTTSVSSIQLSNASSGNSINLNTYTWDKSGLVGLNMPASATWTAVFGYNKVTTFTPSLRVNYVYPVYSTMVD
ncbi:MAG: hypothetical protein II653_00015 [Lachnospiraceae bacterium]|jgi:hypothetical protein|nr:hypothetical protein [Eubacterium sp.]MBQ3932125.1 hypothetical protein [Lachnospiraceae bacterium]